MTDPAPQRRSRSLRARLVAAIGLVALLSVALAFAIGAALTRRAVERNTLRDVAAQADLLAERERVSLLPCARLKSLRPFLARQRERAICTRPDGSSPYLPPERARLLRRGTPLNGTLTVDGTRYFYAARLVGRQAFILLRPTDLVASAWRPHLNGLVIGAVAAGVLAALAALLLARAISRPVRRVAEASRSLAAGRAPKPVPVEGPSELAVLSSSFNDMAVQLERARAVERRFLLSVSHELKTPLTAIRGYAEALVDGAISVQEAAETIAREAERLDRLVRDLLYLARMNRIEFCVRR